MTGKELSTLLKRYKITQQALANYFDITRQAVHYWTKQENTPKPWGILLKQFFDNVKAKELDDNIRKEYNGGDTETESQSQNDITA